jgi:outer membrane immunogenic protein
MLFFWGEVEMTLTRKTLAVLALLGSGISLAHAADLRMPLKAPPAVIPVFSWTGCYVGVEGGGNWGRSQHFQDDPFVVGAAAVLGLSQTGGINLSGGMAGGTIGCNYQTGNLVFGVENDFSWTNKKGTASLIPPFVTTDSATTSESWIGTFRGRVGYAWDRWLVFGTGGAAITREAHQLCGPVSGCAGAAANVAGWTAGAGVEYAFLGAWSVKAEYLHADFGRQTFTRATLPAGGFFAARDVTLTDDMVRVGINYAFMPMK